MQLCLLCLSHDMSTSTNHVPQKAKQSQQIFCLRRKNNPRRYFASGDKIDKTANCLAGYGRAGLEKNRCCRSTGS